RLLLEPPLLAPARLLVRSRAVLLDPRLERVLDRGRGQQPGLASQPDQVRAGDAAREHWVGVAGRRLPAGAALGVRAARAKRRGREALGQRLLGVGPFAVQSIEADAAEHRSDHGFDGAGSIGVRRGRVTLEKPGTTRSSGGENELNVRRPAAILARRRWKARTVTSVTRMNQRIDTKLSVNLNKVALLRNQRDVGYPSVTG